MTSFDELTGELKVAEQDFFETSKFRNVRKGIFPRGYTGNLDVPTMEDVLRTNVSRGLVDVKVRGNEDLYGISERGKRMVALCMAALAYTDNIFDVDYYEACIFLWEHYSEGKRLGDATLSNSMFRAAYLKSLSKLKALG